jgi:hypothetical protein
LKGGIQLFAGKILRYGSHAKDCLPASHKCSLGAEPPPRQRKAVNDVVSLFIHRQADDGA